MSDASYDFRRFVHGAVEDGILGQLAERELLEHAGAADLPEDEAGFRLFQTCRDQGIVVESLDIRAFGELIDVLTEDGFLEESDYAFLKRRGKIYSISDGMIERLITNRLERRRGIREESFRSSSRRAFRAKAKEGRLPPDLREAIVQQKIQELRSSQVKLGEDEIREILDECCDVLPMPPSLPRTWFIIFTAAAGLVTFLLLWIVLGSGDGKQSAMEQFPICEQSCSTALRNAFVRMEDAAAKRSYTSPSDDSVKKWYTEIQVLCRPFEALPAAEKLSALQRSPAWQSCDRPLALFEAAEEYYLGQAQSAKNPCSLLSRCRELVPDGRCREEARRLRCVEVKS